MDNENDNTETIIYQGQKIAVEPMGEMGGYMGKLRGHGRGGEDQLFRDEAGRYYLRQKRFVESGTIQFMHEAEAAGVLFERVHAINVNAAILWAISFTGTDGWKLRCDAADLLMEGRGYADPQPMHLSAEQRAMVSDPDRFAKQRGPGAGSDRITVELDDLASAMLRKTCKEGDATHHAGENLRDLVNTAVTFYLVDDRNDQFGEFDLSDGADALARAKRDRLSLEAAEQEPPSVDESDGVETQPGIHRFTFDYPATRRTCGLRRTVEVSDEQMQRAGELAVHFDLAPTEFLRRLADQNHLPGQARRSENKLRGLLKAENVAFVCMDESMAKRIERAAQSRNQTADEFVAEALGGDVDMWEENMLLHPTTGELLEADFETLFTETESEMIVPPIGREHEPQFQTHHGRQYVRFGAYLTPEQLERLEFPHMISDCSTDEEVPTLLIPFDAEASPFLEVGGQRVQFGHTVQPAQAEEAA